MAPVILVKSIKIVCHSKPLIIAPIALTEKIKARMDSCMTGVPEPLDLQGSGRVLVWYIGHGFNENAANAALERMTGKLVARRIQRHKKVRLASL